MSWLLHKFAKASQNLPLLAVMAIGTGIGAGALTTHSMTETPDTIAGPNRDGLVQMFEQDIVEMGAKEKNYLALASNNDNEAEYLKWSLEKEAKEVRRQINLSADITEVDYISLSGKYNNALKESLAFMDVEGAAYLHEAQKFNKLPDDVTVLEQSDRFELSDGIEKSMINYARNPIIFQAAVTNATLTFLLAFVVSGVLFGSERLMRKAEEDSPQSPLDKLSEKAERKVHASLTQKLNKRDNKF